MLNSQAITVGEPFSTQKESFSPYPAYKPSGVPWLGDIPAHWEVRRLKFLAPLVSIKLSRKPEDMPYIGLENIESQTGKLLSSTQPEGVESTIAYFQAGDILFSKLRPYLAKVWLAEFDGVCTTELLVLRPRKVVSRRFLLYQLLSDGFINIVNAQTYGTKMPRANWEQIGGLHVPLPPLPEQRAIARFLDRETGRIDALIARKQRLIELLREKRAALITRAVTRGLNPDAPLKDSGVPWLGKIPGHWELRKLKHVVHLQSGDSITSERIWSSGPYPVYGGNGLRGYTDTYTHEGNFVLIGRQGALCGNINYASGKFFASEHAIVATPITRLAIIWLGELLRAMNLNQYSFSAAQPGISVDKIKQLYIPFPPYEEQRAIADYLDRETGRIDALIQKIEASIETWKEYRTALITAAVTGKIDVREKGSR